jgi:hypothetical protein
MKYSQKMWLVSLVCVLVSFAIPGAQAQGNRNVQQVSGGGAQASAHAGSLSLMGTPVAALDVQVAFNENNNMPGMNPTIWVLVTETMANGQKLLFSSPGWSTVSYSIANGSLNITAGVVALEQTTNGPTSGLPVVLNLAWSTTSTSEHVTAQSSYSQPGYLMNQDLSGDLQRATVSGTITVDGVQVPLAGTPSYWNTSNLQTNQIVGPNSSPDALELSSTCTAPGYWTGYWTWYSSPPPGSWVWTWVFVPCS